MFPFPVPHGKTPAERNTSRDARVTDAVNDAIAALNSMLTDLRTLQTEMTRDEWFARSDEGDGYHRAEFVGRQFTEASHGLRRYYDAAVMATTTAGGYEAEGA